MRLNRNTRKKRRWLESTVPPWEMAAGTWIHSFTNHSINEYDTSDYNNNRSPEDHQGIIGEKKPTAITIQAMKPMRATSQLGRIFFMPFTF